jgi:hypothetical protein
MFASVNTGAGIATFVPLTTGLEASEQFRPSWRGQDERLWRVRSSGMELQRFTGDGVAPLAKDVIVAPATSALPAGASRGGSVTFKLQVKVRSSSGNYEFFMDAGQAVEVVGKDVEVGLFGPANSVEVVPSTPATVTQTGLVIDSVIGVALNAAEQAMAQTAVHFTQHFFVAANTQTSIAVPRYARGIKVFTGTGPAPAASWERWIGDPAIVTNGLRVGTVDFAAGTSIPASDQVGDETHIRVDLDANNARLFTVVWTIKP